jgi:hypothetical protein
MSNVDLSVTLKYLQNTATAQVAQWPQYIDHFVGYKLVRIKSDVKTKAGLALKCREYAIAIPQRNKLPSSGRYITVWSRRNMVDTSVRVAVVEWL